MTDGEISQRNSWDDQQVSGSNKIMEVVTLHTDWPEVYSDQTLNTIP